MKQYLEPNYLETDFQTSKQSLQQLMKESDVFRDYNFDGSNITMLIELMAYVVDNSTYFSNKIIKNIYPESSETFETMHSVGGIRGYKPKGYISPHLEIEISVIVDGDDERLPSPGHQLNIPAWFAIDTGLETEEGNSIRYTTTDSYTVDIPSDQEDSSEFKFTIPLKQGHFNVQKYTGEDIVDYKIILPTFMYDHDLRPYDENPGIRLYVNGEPWERVDTFEQDVSAIKETEKKYMLEYDKYERYNIVFSPVTKIPRDNDQISVVLNRTLGTEGSIGSEMINIEKEDEELNNTIPVISETGDIEYNTVSFIRNLSATDNYNNPTPVKFFNITNPVASFKASNPETVDEIKDNSRNIMFSQYRNISSEDYQSHLEEHPDITKGNSWGEAEVNPQNTYEYNKVYISVIPSTWGEDTTYLTSSTSASISESTSSTSVSVSGSTLSYPISGHYEEWYRDDMELTSYVFVPEMYSRKFKNIVLKHLEPRKYVASLNEEFVLPSLVYFAFDFGLRIKRGYDFTAVSQELRNKLIFYFKNKNRNFNETIDFKDLYNYLLDLTRMDDRNRRWLLIRGIRNLIFRDIITFTPNLTDEENIFEPNDENNFPMFTVEEWEYGYDNILRPIKLGYNQFPLLVSNSTTILNES